MPLLRDAGKLFVGSQAVQRCYVGSTLVWQPSGTGTPTPDITNLRVAAAQVNDANPVTIPRPTGSLAGDVILVHHWFSSDRPTPGAPSGWTLLQAFAGGGAGGVAGLAIYGKVIGSGDGTGYAFTGNPGNNAYLVLSGTGISSSNVFDVAPLVQASQSVAAPSVTPTLNNGVAVSIHGAQGAAVTGSTTLWTPPGTIDGSVQISGEWNSGLLAYRKYATPAAHARTATPPAGIQGGSGRGVAYVLRAA